MRLTRLTIRLHKRQSKLHHRMVSDSHLSSAAVIMKLSRSNSQYRRVQRAMDQVQGMHLSLQAKWLV